MTSPSPPRSFPAGEREAIVRCPPCGQPIVMGELVSSCPACGTVHHTACWTQYGGCGTYACAPARRESVPSGAGVMKVTVDDIERAPARIVYVAEHGAQLSKIAWAAEQNSARTWNRLCIIAFIIALVSIPLFGYFTGWLAALLGCIALVIRKPRERGLGLGIGGVLIGLASAAAWTGIYLHGLDPSVGSTVLSFDRYDIDPETLRDVPEKISRPMRSNVLISTSSGLGGFQQSVGSGVVLKIASGTALILTNRHVVDPKFHGRGEADDPLPTAECTVKFLGRPKVDGSVVWIAPFGVDAALLRVALADTKDVVAACWAAKPKFHVAEKVFVVGNPMGLGWSHASGEISQVRREEFGTLDVRIIQTSAPVNHGNSGGGLYDDDGLLLGINTWTQDKRSAEGLGFSIAFQSILELIPKSFEIPASQDP